MADFYNYCNWYTVWDAKTGDLIASGTSAMVARRLGYKSTAAFTTHYAHTQTRKPKKPYKYIMRRELVERREAELPPPLTRGKGRKHHEDGPMQSRPHWTGNWCGCLTRIGCGPAP